MWFVYIIKSLRYNFIYIGSTNDLQRRLEEHNSGISKSTFPYKPFELEAYIAVKAKVLTKACLLDEANLHFIQACQQIVQRIDIFNIVLLKNIL
jgi:predicted GIY-YIG superfamily endonuclease